MMTRRGANTIVKTAKATANFMVDEDRDDGDGGMSGGGPDRRSDVDGDGNGGAGGRRGDASKKTMATAMSTTRSKRKIFSDGKGGGEITRVGGGGGGLPLLP